MARRPRATLYGSEMAVKARLAYKMPASQVNVARFVARERLYRPSPIPSFTCSTQVTEMIEKVSNKAVWRCPATHELTNCPEGSRQAVVRMQVAWKAAGGRPPRAAEWHLEPLRCHMCRVILPAGHPAWSRQSCSSGGAGGRRWS